MRRPRFPRGGRGGSVPGGERAKAVAYARERSVEWGPPSTTSVAVRSVGPDEADLYLVSSDVVGTDWVFGRVNVFDRSEPLYRCE